MKKRNIIHSALSLSLTAALCLSMAACGKTQPPADSSAASAAPAQPAAVQPAAEKPTSTALPVKALHPKQVEENPYMAKSDANIHHDGYNTDSTDEILPLGIYPEINVSYEKTNANASPAIYFDSYGHAVVPLLGGIAIRDLNAEETKTLGYFSPKQHDGGGRNRLGLAVQAEDAVAVDQPPRRNVGHARLRIEHFLPAAPHQYADARALLRFDSGGENIGDLFVKGHENNLLACFSAIIRRFR